MYWSALIVAGLLEAAWLFFLQKSQLFTHIPYVIMAVVSMVCSLVLFSIALKEIPISQAYLIWLAVGVCSISIVNHYFFDQTLSLFQMGCFVLILVGVVGLKISN